MKIAVILLVKSSATLLQQRSQFETESWHSAVDEVGHNTFLLAIIHVT